MPNYKIVVKEVYGGWGWDLYESDELGHWYFKHSSIGSFNSHGNALQNGREEIARQEERDKLAEWRKQEPSSVVYLIKKGWNLFYKDEKWWRRRPKMKPIVIDPVEEAQIVRKSHAIDWKTIQAEVCS